MIILKLIAPAFILATLSCSSWQQEKTDENSTLHLQMGMTLLKQNQIPQAISELSQAAADNPTDSHALFYLGQAYYLRKKYDLAEKEMEKALKLDPTNSEIMYGLAQVKIADGRFAGAILNLKKVAADLTYPFPDIVFENMGYCYYQIKRYPEAEKNYLQALDLKNQNCPALSGLGKTYYQLKEMDQSLRSFAQALTYCPSDQLEEVYYYSALDYLKLNKKGRAESSLKDLIQFFPNGTFRGKAEAMLPQTRSYQ